LNAGGSAPSRLRGADIFRFPHRLAPGASVGLPGSNSNRILMGVCGRNAGGSARSPWVRADNLDTFLVLGCTAIRRKAV
jgi:hypothetical protein